MKGHTVYENEGAHTFQRVDGKGAPGKALFSSAKQIAKRTCILIMESMEDNIAGVFFHHRHAPGPENLIEQACYWLLKCNANEPEL
jgi:hypothetical protein